MFDNDEDDGYLPIPRRSHIDRHVNSTAQLISDHEDSPCDRRQSRCLLNNSFSIDSAVDEAIQTPIQLIALYEKTLELVAKNKINAKNAFHIPLVERLPQVLDVVAFDEKIDCHDQEPNFVKAGSVIDTSAKIYGFRVDALHTETQKLNGSIQQKDDEEENTSIDANVEENTGKKMIQRNKPKAISYLVTDLSTISLSYELDFHPLQPPTMCQWPGGVGDDSIYADMVSSTMYSSSDFPLIHGFINLNSRINREFDQNERILDFAVKTNFDLIPLRDAIKENEEQNHFLGCQSLREFSFNEDATNSYIDTIDECSVMDSSMLSSPEDPTNEMYSHACSELRDDPSQFYFQEMVSAHTFPTTMISMELTQVPSKISFVDHIPHLLRDKTNRSDYNYYDAIKLKLFAGPYLWKYTNLLSEQIKVEEEPSQICLPMKNKSIRSIRSYRFDLFQLDRKRSIDKLMKDQNFYRRGLKRSQRKTLSTTLQHSRRKNNDFHQLRLARKMQPVTHLCSLHHFPDCNLDILTNPYEIGSTMIIDDDDDHQPYFDEPPLLIEPMEYDFVRPVHYEKIEIDRNFAKVDAKKLQLQLIDEYKRQSTATTSPINFSSLVVELLDQGIISSDKDQLVSTFYCMLNNCHKNQWYMKNNLQRDDLIIQKELSVDSTPLSYSYTLS